LICVAPTIPGTIPTNAIGAFCPATVTLTGRIGCDN
jgi:hypothetical protein